MKKPTNPRAKALLTKRQKEIFLLICKGCNTAFIATQLFVSEYTVENHRRAMLRRSECSNFAELAVRYFEIDLEK